MSSRGSVLVVDDEAYVRDSLAVVLERRGYKVRVASRAEEALAERALDGVDAVVTDLRMPGVDGLALLKRLGETDPGLPVVVLTGHGTVPSAVDCMRAGAHDYLLKPADPEVLGLILERAIGDAGRRRELEYLRGRSERGAGGAGEPLGVSRGWLEAVRLAELAAAGDSPVLLVGESGTGKEEVAKVIHRRSVRARSPLVRVNCAAIPTELFESEFFGHRRGAFTGAVADRDGRFRVAHRGTLFLDEIDSLPLVAQAKVLRVLQDGLFERVGDSHPTAVDVRLVSATNSDLDAAVESGRFRRDLFYRVNVVTIHLPPLRERKEDIPLLARAFLADVGTRLGRRVPAIEPGAIAALERYRWPGNVRELRNVIERAVLLTEGPELTVASLPFAPAADADPGLNLRAALAAEERRLLNEALRVAGGVRREAARLLGIDERNLPYFLKKHGLQRTGREP